MSTTVLRRRSKTNTSSPSLIPAGLNSLVFSAAMSDFEMQIYGKGHAPLYDLVSAYGELAIINTIDTAFQSFDEIKQTLKEADAGYSYSDEFNQFTLALKLPGGGIVFAGLLHDKNGSPRVDEQLVLCRIKANRDFEFEGNTIIKQGQEFLKALPESYLAKIKQAA